MDKIREQIKNPLVSGIGGLVVGLLVGLLVGWVIWPVQYKDAAPEHLQIGFQEDYLSMAIDSFRVNPDVPLAQRRWKDLGPGASDVLKALEDQSTPATIGAINQFKAAVVTTAAITGATEAAPVPGEPGTTTTETKKTSPLGTVLLVMCGLTLLLGIGFGIVYLLKSRNKPVTITPAMQAQEAARQAEWTDYSTTGGEPPISQFMASYKIGDDLFDDSFSIDSPNGEFLGECGVGISETIGVGDPKKVTAFEVWLFDKNDIQTVTKVLMSAHAFENEAILHRLSAKGEPVLAEPGGQITLETATLRLTASIHDMNYGEGALPEKSFFDTLILEIAVWQKA